MSSYAQHYLYGSLDNDADLLRLAKKIAWRYNPVATRLLSTYKLPDVFAKLERDFRKASRVIQGVRTFVPPPTAAWLNRLPTALEQIAGSVRTHLASWDEGHQEVACLTNISRLVYDELLAVRSQWKGCEILWKKDRLVVPIGKIYLPDPDSNDLDEIYIGDFKLTICYKSFRQEESHLLDDLTAESLQAIQVGDVRLIDHGKPVLEEGYPHPHVNADGQVCFGDRLEPVLKMWNVFGLFDVICATVEALKSYNPSDKYEAVEKWRKFDTWAICEECKDRYTPPLECGCHICADCTSLCGNLGCLADCPQCHTFARCTECRCRHCEDHATACQACGNDVCLSCAHNCEGCGESFCGSCLRSCSTCGDQFCESCVTSETHHDCVNDQEDEDDDENDEASEVDEDGNESGAANASGADDEEADAAGPSETQADREADSDVLSASVSEGEVCLSSPESGS